VFGQSKPWSRGTRLTAVIGGLVLAAGSAVGIGVAAGLGQSFAATGDSPEMASVQALLAKAPKPGSNKIGPFANDFIDIKKVNPNNNTNVGGASGTFSVDCGTNQNNHHNSDNFIATPGVDHGAHHVHDYVGNRTTTARSTDRSLAAGGTTCANNDKSTYYWPVIRIKQEPNGKNNNQRGPDPGNIGRLVEPSAVTIKFTSGGAGKVTALPQFLRSVTGDAKVITNGLANARPTWTCTGFENRITEKYPVCPQGSSVERIFNFPSCWDGQNLDSANHRTHLVFPRGNGQCPRGKKAVPALQYDLVYNTVPNGSVFAVDGFDGQLHNPATDHADWENVMTAQQMNGVVGCINGGQQCVNQPGGSGGGGVSGQPASNQRVTCPDVRGKLPTIPAQAQAEVTRNLDLLDQQITEADNRIASTQGQGGPNFIQNAILGPLKDKRIATIDRIAIAIGRVAAKPQGLDALASCGLTSDSGINGSGGANGQPAGNQHVTCPEVRGRMPAIPSSVKSAVTQDLDQMDNFLTDANNRLLAAGSQATPDFINNAILGSLQNNRQFLINQILNLFNQARAPQPQGNLISMAGCSMTST
jgi:hypothetical protein